MTAELLALCLAIAVPDVAGDSTCPAPAQVRERLSVLASEREGKAEPAAHRAYLSSTERAVHVELLDADGGLLAERSLDKSGTCEDLALAVAVVLATWEAELDPGLARGATPLPAAPAPAPEPVIVTEHRETTPSVPVRFDAGLGLLASMVGTTPAVGARLAGCLFPTASSLGLSAALSATSTREQSIAEPTSSAKWLRAALSLGPDYRFGRTAPALDLHASAVLALLHTQGVGLPRTASDTSLELGVAAGMRGLWAWHNAAGWLSADVFVYPGEARLTVGNYGVVDRLPGWEVTLALGISLGQFR